MLIVPVFTKNDLNKAPYVCIALIVINCLIFCLLQQHDDEYYQEAISYYHDSGLMNLELPAYHTYLAKEEEAGAHVDIENEEERFALY